jgi:hypothetical protein
MKSIFTTIFLVIFSSVIWAANLTATTSSTGTGLKTGKINLTITGGFAPYTIVWTGPGGYSSGKLNPDSLAAGTYCVTVTDQYCGVAKLCVTVTEQSSINEIALSKTKIYPNPFTRKLSVELDEQLKSQKVNLTLFDQLGRVVAQNSFTASGRIDWDFGKEISAGTYILNVETEDGLKITRQICSIGK